MHAKQKNIVIFASGSGSNAQRIMEYFNGHTDIRVAALFSNNPQAYALERAKNFGVAAFTFTRHEFTKTGEVLKKVQEFKPDLIVLAGFLWLVPDNFLEAFPNKIINIHPALLPKFGGKGMHGMNVHSAVVESGETESGITIHFINNEYDKGDIILQHRCPVLPQDTPEDVAGKVLKLEHEFLPKVIETILQPEGS